MNTNWAYVEGEKIGLFSYNLQPPKSQAQNHNSIHHQATTHYKIETQATTQNPPQNPIWTHHKTPAKTHPNLSNDHHPSGPASPVSTPTKNTDHADSRMMPKNADSRTPWKLQFWDENGEQMGFKLGFLGSIMERREELGLREN